jgi:hypothetical protein
VGQNSLPNPQPFTALDGDGAEAFGHEEPSWNLSRLHSRTQGAEQDDYGLSWNDSGGGVDQPGHLFFQTGYAAGEVGVSLFCMHLFASKLERPRPRSR